MRYSRVNVLIDEEKKPAGVAGWEKGGEES